MRLRRVIAGVTNDEHRLRITQILDAIIDNQTMGLMEFIEVGEQAEILLTLGFDVASTYARGQEIDTDLQKRWEQFQGQVKEADAWHEKERKESAEKWQKVFEERRAARPPRRQARTLGMSRSR